MNSRPKAGAIVIGSGNIGTDLMVRIQNTSERLTTVAMVGIDPVSDGLVRADRLGVATTSDGTTGLASMSELAEAEVIFDATWAGAHAHHAAFAREHDKLMVDLTPAALGPYVIPAVNLDETQYADNANMVTCGGQATIPIVAAVSLVAPVAYAEIVTSIASRSAGPGTRADIDKFTETTRRGIESVGGAAVGMAIVILTPAEPSRSMRATVYCVVEDGSAPEELDRKAVHASILDFVARVRHHVPGYRLKQDIQFDRIVDEYIPALGRRVNGTRVVVYLEVSGAGHYLPEYAGNLDITTSAALRTAERILELRNAVPL